MDLQYKRLNDKWVMLTKDLHFGFTLNEVYAGSAPYLREIISKTGIDPDKQLYLIAPKGFVCDLTSIPEPLQGLFKPDGPYAPAAALHDLLYQNTHEGTFDGSPLGLLNSSVDRFFADRIFLLGMRTLGINPFVRMAFYDGVRLGGSGPYQDPNTDCEYERTPNLVYRMAEPYYFIRDKVESGIPIDHSRIVGTVEHAHVQYPNIKRAFLSFKEVKENVPS